MNGRTPPKAHRWLVLVFVNLCVCVLPGAFTSSLQAQSTQLLEMGPAAADSAITLRSKEHRLAIEKGLAILRKGVDNYPKHRDCFSCHHQAVPLFVFSLAELVSRQGDVSFMSSQDYEAYQSSIVAHTRKSFSKQLEAWRSGKSMDGKALSAGYGLWTLGMAKSTIAPADEVADRLADYLLQTQRQDGGWDIDSVRPPAASSEWVATALAMDSLLRYSVQRNDPALNARIDAAMASALRKIQTTEEPHFNEDFFGFVWCKYLPQNTSQARRWMDRISAQVGHKKTTPSASSGSMMYDLDLAYALTKRQLADGGWGQEPEMESDPYSTGTSLIMLSQITNRYGSIKERQHAVDYLIKSQCEDGSWHVSSRATPVQEYFDNGDPHDTDQFISMLATGWSTAGLLTAWQDGNGLLPLDRVIVRPESWR